MEDFVKMIEESSKQHPSRVLDFQDLIDGLFAEVDKGNVKVSYHPLYPQLAIFKYTPSCVTEKNWNQFTVIARGLILDLKDKKVIATSFPKFFNYGEMEELSCSFLDSKFIVSEKVDGCCHEDVILVTEDGEMTIKDICEKKYNGKILSYNIYEDKVEFKQIEGYFVSSNSKQWYELELEDGTKIKLTGNHKVYLPDLSCYRKVEDLNGNERFLLKK
jgi:intein/homing endonuclease